MMRSSWRTRTVPNIGKRLSVPMFLAVGAVLSMVLAACSTNGNSSASSSANSGSSNGKGTLGFLSFWTGGDPFATSLANATLAEGKKLGVTIDYVNGNNDLSTQIGAIQDFITKRVKAIVVFPGNATALVPILNKAAASGIPVIDLNERLAKNAKIYTYVGDNDYTYGQLEARALAKALHGKGTFALAEGTIGYASQIDRTAGIKNVLQSYPNIHMVAAQSDNYNSAQSLSLTQDWTNKYPSLNAIVVEGPEGVTGAEWAAKHGHKNLKFVVGDYPTFVAPAIKNGEVYAAVDQSPILEAKDSVIAAYDVMKGQGNKVPKPNWYVPLPIITKANVNSIKPAW